MHSLTKAFWSDVRLLNLSLSLALKEKHLIHKYIKVIRMDLILNVSCKVYYKTVYKY